MPMPRRARLFLPGVPLHVIQRGNNRQACFFTDEDRSFYLQWLAEHSRKAGCAIHAFVLMTNHVHLLVSTDQPNGVAAMMKAVGQRYVQYINRTYRRSGTLWEGRFRSCLVQDAGYLLGCHRYIELNPVRAGMVEHPAEYRWSSYRANAQGEACRLLTPHPEYLALDGNESRRRDAYRDLFRYELEPGLVDAIRSATNGNYALGDERFSAQITQALGRRVVRGKSGRPRRLADDTTRDIFSA